MTRDIPQSPRSSAAGDDADYIRARIAWYYFAGGLTQQEIASLLGITRLRVNKTVGQLRSDGSVRIEIRLPLSDCVVMEERLKERYGLAEVRVVPSMGENGDAQRVIGEAAGEMLEARIRDGIGVAVGWGRTLSFAMTHLRARDFSGAWVASLMGGLTRGSGTNTFEVATALAGQLGSDCYYLAAPIYVPTAQSRDLLVSHHGLAETLRRLRSADLAFVSCGDMSPLSLLIQTQTVTENIQTLRDAGAVGDLLGYFLDAEGRIVDHPLNERVMAISPRELAAIPDSILASGGAYKAPVVRAVLRAGYVKRLVTDEACAAELLK
ncbi:sugar-binding transcriptional regulator [Acidimangrovimonas sediminis]|uniref:sugar-binding transcriptional regulator n=1 Tax=Acidimangrovimonas sediminis TaxID=2056283 RepID=UPI0018ECC238|nr:sugar-binding transcriptional regulator [Acidimangrovimonas sediminis]